jgi:outer membrane lipoprotein-sorting protein
VGDQPNSEGLPELLVLLYRAHASFRSVRGVLRDWRDLELSEEAVRHEIEQQEQQRAASGGRVTSRQIAFAAGPHEPEPPRELETSIRFWLERPDRVREEHRSSHPYGQDGAIMVKRGELWWHYDPRSGAISNEDELEVGSGVGQQLEQLLDPVDLLAGRELEIVGEREAAGRPALEVRSRPRPSNNPTIHGYPFGAQEFHHLVDRERGILLRTAAIFRGEELGVTELTEVVFDETFPDETFVLELPAGESFASPGTRHPYQHLTLEEAVERASFPLWVVPRLPEGEWRMLIVHVEPRERPPVQEMVHINYLREDAQHQLQLSQSPLGGQAAAWAAHQQPETIERDGNRYQVLRGEPGPLGPPTTLLFERGQTSIQMSSPTLELETLLELADSLRPA